MKRISTSFKKAIIHIGGGGLICTALLNLTAMSSSNAQTAVYPTLTDNYWISSPSALGISTIEVLNASVITYLDSSNNPNQLYAMAEYGNINPGAFYVGDRTSGCTVTIPYTIPDPLVNPDIIIGNDATNPTTDYHIAVSYLNNGNGVIDYYLVHYYTPGYFHVTYTSTSTIQAMPALNSVYGVHLDIIAEETNVLPTGLPYCDNFVITWADISGNIFVDMASINTPPAYFPTLSVFALPAYSYPLGWMPDVAGVQKYPGGVIDGPIHNYALVTYVDYYTTNQLYFTECDFTAASCSTYSASVNEIDDGSYSTEIYEPRIDAPDFASFSVTYTVTAEAQYKIVAGVTDLSGNQIVNTYDNTLPLLGYYNGWSSTNYVPFGIPCISPCVAVDLPGLDYDVQHYTTNADVWMEPINWMDPIQFFNPPAENYYEINTTSPEDISYSTGPNAISNSPNLLQRYGGGLLNVWAFLDPSNPWYDADYKFDATGGLFDYLYRNSNGTNTATGATDVGWQIYPNPVKNYLIVNNGSGDNKATSYTICDVVGRELLQGDIDSAQLTEINTGNLLQGDYLVTLYRDNTKIGCERIVKIAE